MALSTVPAGVIAEALGYLREGGPANLRELAAFLSDTVLLTGEGFAPPEPAPSYGVHALPISTGEPGPVGQPGPVGPSPSADQTAPGREPAGPPRIHPLTSGRRSR